VVAAAHRPEPPRTGSEKETLEAYLDYHRATALWKLEGLSDEDVRRPMTPSGLTMLGLIKHMAYSERWWFQGCFLGQDVEVLWSWDEDEDDPDAEFRVEPDETTEGIVTMFREETERARDIVHEASLDDLSRLPRRSDYSLRWILLHTLQETARHNGHLDLMRESLDGTTGE